MVKQAIRYMAGLIPFFAFSLILLAHVGMDDIAKTIWILACIIFLAFMVVVGIIVIEENK